MTFVIQDIGHGLKTVAVDTAKFIEEPIQFLAKAEKVIASAIQDQPAVKQAVMSLVQQAQTVIADTVGDVAGKGLNLAAAAKTLSDAEQFFAYFKDTFMPLVESLYAEVKADVAS